MTDPLDDMVERADKRAGDLTKGHRLTKYQDYIGCDRCGDIGHKPQCSAHDTADLIRELLAALEAASPVMAEMEGEIERLRAALEAREAFVRMVDEDNDAEPFDQADERRRLVLSIEALDTGDLHTAAVVIYDTQGRIAREFLSRKYEAAALATLTPKEGEGDD